MQVYFLNHLQKLQRNAYQNPRHVRKEIDPGLMTKLNKLSIIENQLFENIIKIHRKKI